MFPKVWGLLGSAAVGGFRGQVEGRAKREKSRRQAGRLFGEAEGVGGRGNKWVDIPDLIPVAPECLSLAPGVLLRRAGVTGTKGAGLRESLARLGLRSLLVAEGGTGGHSEPPFPQSLPFRDSRSR